MSDNWADLYTFDVLLKLDIIRIYQKTGNKLVTRLLARRHAKRWLTRQIADAVRN